MATVLKKTIVLVGMMGAGKTAVGKALAAALGVPFLDSDEEIVRAANMQIADIFARDGETFFRDKETRVISRLLQETKGVLSTGGGAFLSQRNRDIISEHGVSLWLDADLELLWDRVKHKTTRPLLHTDNPRATLADIYNARVPTYQMAELSVKADAKYSIIEMTGAVLKVLKAHPDIIEEIPGE